MPPEVLCKAAMGSPFTAKECWLALTEALSARPERTGSGNTELIRLLIFIKKAVFYFIGNYSYEIKGPPGGMRTAA